MKKVLSFLLILQSFIFAANPVYSSADVNLESCTALKGKIWSIAFQKNMSIALDSTVNFAGRYSICYATPDSLKSSDKPIGMLRGYIPWNYSGDSIALKIQVKADRLDSTGGTRATILFYNADNTLLQNMTKFIKPDANWQPINLKAAVPENTEHLLAFCNSDLKGKTWVDDFQFCIDNRSLELVKPRSYPADEDTVSFTGIDNLQIENNPKNLAKLADFCQVWGFVKYYHPSVAKGLINMDGEFLRLLPGIVNTKNMLEYNDFIYNWLNSLGRFESDSVKIDNSDDKPYLKMVADLANFTNPKKYDSSLCEIFQRMINKKAITAHYYFKINGMGKPVLLHEKSYQEKGSYSVQLRLLTLFRYWNAVNYFHAYKYAMDSKWNNSLSELLPEYISAKDSTALLQAVLKTAARINDAHAFVRHPSVDQFYGNNYLPFRVDFVENKPVVTQSLAIKSIKTDLKNGDEILAINGQDIVDYIKEIKSTVEGSNQASLLRNIGRRMIRSNADSLNLKVKRNGKTLILNEKTYPKNELDTEILYSSTNSKLSYSTLKGNIGYLNLGNLRNKDIDSLYLKIKETKGLIIDIRSYPSEFPLYALAAKLLPDSVAFIQCTRSSLNQPGCFQLDNHKLYIGNKKADKYQGKVIILVNELTQSRAEFHAIGLKMIPGTVVMGSQSAGADGEVPDLLLPNGLTAYFTGIGYYYPNGAEAQRSGVKIDILVKPTIKGISQGLDEVLEKAVELIAKAK